LEQSLASNRLRNLLPRRPLEREQTILPGPESYRLLRYGGAKRGLFMVDRISLGEQALREFTNYVTPDDRRKLGELYNGQLLRSNQIDQQPTWSPPPFSGSTRYCAVKPRSTRS